jgi:hypothetical protein
MPFQKGNKLSPGGKIGNKGGRPSREKTEQKRQAAEVKQKAAEVARAMLEKHLGPIMETYVGLAVGKVVVRETPEGKKEFTLEVNAKTNMDAVGKILPPAKQEVEHSGLIVHELKTNIPSEDEEEERLRSARLVGPGES